MRLEGQVKLGYYPTPIAIAQTLAQGFIPPADGAPWTALDPFCGTGEALAAFHAPQAYGVDVDTGRLADAATRLTATCEADAFALVRRSSRTSLLLLNPPYDTDPITHERQEARAVRTFVPWVHPHGWILLIVQRALLLNRFLRQEWDRLLTIRACWRFPDADYPAFGQCVLIAQPRRIADPPNAWETTWLTDDPPPEVPNAERWEQQRWQLDTERRFGCGWPAPLPDTLPPQWTLPAASPYALVSREPTPAQLLDALAASNIWGPLREQTAPPPSLSTAEPITTPLTLHRGHLATLLTAGRLTGAIGTGAARHLVKGRVVPYTVVTERTEDREITESRYRVELFTLHPDGTLRAWHARDDTEPTDYAADAESAEPVEDPEDLAASAHAASEGSR